MALEREARTEYMGSEIDKRNRNWQKIDTFFAEVPETITNSDGTAFKFPSGLLVFYSNEFTLTYNAGNLLQASRNTPVEFKGTDYFVKPQINIPGNRVGLYQDVVVASSSSYTVRLISSSATNFVASNTTKARVFGIGRWK